jgi:hypothetical protein
MILLKWVMLTLSLFIVCTLTVIGISIEQSQKTIGVPEVTVIGNVSPATGFIQAWDEKDALYAFTYTVWLKNWSSAQPPWIELYVRPQEPDQPWKLIGDKKSYDPSIGSVSWTLKPFWETPFIGKAEYRFLIDGTETQTFEGPDIIAVVSNLTDSWSNNMHNFEATFNSSKNLTICLVGGDSVLPENIKKWTAYGQCKDYIFGSGMQILTWQIAENQIPYYDFDIKVNDTKEL